MRTNKKSTGCQTLVGVNKQRRERSSAGTASTYRVVKLLRVLIPAVLISITLIACTGTVVDTTLLSINGIRISTSTTTSVTLTANTNKTGKLFWVAYTDGTDAPANAAALITAAGQVPNGTIIAASGSAGQAVAAAGMQTVMISGLSADTNYDFYVVAQDAARNASSISLKLDIATADTTVPIVPVISGIRVSTSTTTSVTITVSTNKTGKLFWVAYANSTSPPATPTALITAAGQTPSGTIIAVSGSDGQAVPTVGAQTVTISGLSADTSYDFYVVAQNAAGNTSSISVKLDIATADTTVPVVSGIRVSASTTTSVTITANTSETGKLFWVAYTDGTDAPANAAALITAAGQTPNGTIIAASGSAGQVVTAAGMQTVIISGLSTDTSYDVYVVAQNAAGNASSISLKLDIATADTIVPIVPVVNGIRISTSTTTSVTITANTSETGKLFWVAYTDGTDAPANAAALITAAGQTPNGTIIAASGSAGQAVTAAGMQTVTISGLSADTSYDVYVVAQDAAGNASSISLKLDIATADTTAPVVPVVSGMRISTSTATSVTITANTSETGKLFWVAYTDGTDAPANAAALITAAGQTPNGTIIAASGSAGQAVTAAGMQTVTISGLSADTSYDVYVVAQNAASNASSVSAKLDIATVPMFTLRSDSFVTILCPDAAIGAIGTVNGIAYTKRIRDTITPTNAANTCTSGITDMSNLFENKIVFNADIGSWDVSSVTNMSSMFNNAYAFNQNIGRWDVSSVTDMRFMFNNARAFNQNIGSWNVSRVTDMNSMFRVARAFDQNIGRWNVSGVTDMNGMFNNATAFDQNIGSWVVSGVTNMRFMFNAAHAFNQNIGGWNVSSVTNMGSMFNNARSFNQNIGSWVVSSVVSMNGMFGAAHAFNQNIGDWNVSSVEVMNNMFAFARSFNQNIVGWVVNSVAEMDFMFSSATAFSQNLSTWCVLQITSPPSGFSDGTATLVDANKPIWGTMVSSCTP